MMKSTVPAFYKFAVAVAASCCDTKVSEDMSSSQAAAYINELLSIVFSSTGVSAVAEPIRYPTSYKIPLIITVNDDEQRLLWFCAQMTISELAEALGDLLADMCGKLVPISA